MFPPLENGQIVKSTLTDELLKVNSALKSIFSVIEDQCSGGRVEDIKVRSEEDGTSKQARVKVGKQTAERLPISSSFTLF